MSILNELRGKILKPRQSSAADRADLEAAYELWRCVWRQTLLELDGSDTLHSDEFSRQDEIVSVFHGGRCLALACMRWVDFSLSLIREDSYFKAWTEPALAGLASHGNDIVIGCQITVSPLVRGGALGISFKDVILGLLIERLLESGSDAMTGTMRNDRGMNRSTFQYGAVLLEPNQVLHGVSVDLVAFPRSSVRPSPDLGTAEAVRFLWNSARSVRQAA